MKLRSDQVNEIFCIQHAVLLILNAKPVYLLLEENMWRGS
ncbi:hypothetical protein GGE12_004146 [Rhizobium mongolense]|uniref:Uncharacterized protein n=1 Tax=Rhizobium mongolense TaxID=57676 RepID=A0A7W6WG40_9HYPH|nr:hypothetical protein [Rhizobium mongolense]